MDELHTWLEKVSDDCKMGGYTKAELLAMSETERFFVVQGWTIQDLKNTTVYFNEEGIKIGQTFKGTFLEGYLKDIVVQDSIFETDLYSYTQYADDTTILEIFGYDNYRKFSSVEKMQAKQIEYLTRKIVDSENTLIDNRMLNTYLAASGKTVDQLDDIDFKILNVGECIINDKSAISKLLEAANKYDILKGVNKVGNIIDIVTAVCITGQGVYDAKQAYDSGDTNTAAGIIVGIATESAVSAVVGLTVTSTITPYFAGIGAIIGGPIGAALGTALAGVVGYGFAGLVGSELNEVILDLFSDMDSDYANAGNAVRYVADPLVLDLDGDGFEISSMENGVYFDENAAGLVEKTQWVLPDDALLALDLNEDGIINDGSELFGTSTKLADSTLATSGFEALGQYDKNTDGCIDENDEVFSKLVAWQDKNNDGISQEDEMYTMRELGVTSISTNFASQEGVNVADVTYVDGSSTQIGEFNFEANLYDTIEKDAVEISEDVEALPDVKAIGNVASLHTLLQLDEAGELKELVNTFITAVTREEKEQAVTDILYYITGAKDVASNSRGREFDAQKLTVIESFMGKDFVGTGGKNPVNTAATILEGVYENIYEIYYNSLNAQTHMSNYMKMACWTMDQSGNKYIDTSAFDMFVSACMENNMDLSEEVAEMGRFISYMNADNPNNIIKYVLNYTAEKKYLDALVERIDENILVGTDMVDSILGTSDDDIIFGGISNDRLSGGAGNDRYIFNIGDGADTIYDYEYSTTEGKADRIVFGAGITADSISFERSGNNLLIHYGEGDCITVQDAYWYSDGKSCVEAVEFADGNIGNIDYEIENVVNLLIQDMSESAVDSLSSTDEIATDNSTNKNEQLWVE